MTGFRCKPLILLISPILAQRVLKRSGRL